MIDIALDLAKNSATYGDFKVVNNDLGMITDDKTGIQQHILQRLKTFFGEWFMDVTIGVDYFNRILVKNPIQSDIDAIFIATILGTPGVTEILTYNFSPNFSTRSLAVSFSVQTINGKVNYEGTVSA